VPLALPFDYSNGNISGKTVAAPVDARGLKGDGRQRAEWSWMSRKEPIASLPHHRPGVVRAAAGLLPNAGAVAWTSPKENAVWDFAPSC